MSSKRAQGGTQNNPSSKSNPPATHVYASSIAVPIQSEIAHLETQLTLLSQRISPFLQRDVILSRIDDTDPYRIELESNDSSFAPIRRARLQSRLHIRFQNGKSEMRIYSQAQGATKGLDLVNIKSLVVAEIDSSQENHNNSESDDLLPSEISAGGDHWHQLTLAMGWVPHHTVIRSGHCFTIRVDKTTSIQVYLFHLLKLNDDAKPVTLERVSNTRVLQAVVTIALSSKPEEGSADVANLSDRAYGEMVRLQEALRGLVDLSRDVD